MYLVRFFLILIQLPVWVVGFVLGIFGMAIYTGFMYGFRVVPSLHNIIETDKVCWRHLKGVMLEQQNQKEQAPGVQN